MTLPMLPCHYIVRSSLVPAIIAGENTQIRHLQRVFPATVTERVTTREPA